MPITEVPTSPPSSPPERPSSRRRRNRYEDYETHELFSLIEEYEDERARARMRESIWIAIIVYMCIAWFLLYGPRYILHRYNVIDPSLALKNRKDLTYLDLPPDAIEHARPKPTDKISDKNRVAESRHPAIDQKTLEAMRKAAELARQQQQAQPAPQPSPQQAQQPEPPRPSQPVPPQQQAQLEAPTPAPPRPNFNTGPVSAGDAIRQAARGAARGGQYGGGADLPGISPQHAGLQGGMEILSDTMGVDFGPYLARVKHDTEQAWWPIIPESTKPPLLKRGHVGIRFKIMPDGSVKQMILELPSGDVALDRAAWGGITGASPYPQLPKQFKGPYLELRFYFFYNQEPGVE